MRKTLRNALRLLRTAPLAATWASTRSRLSEEWYEWRFGIDTRGGVALDRYGIVDPQFSACQPISYPSLMAVLKRVTIRAGQDVVVDYGAGKGRAVIGAARLPLQRVIGIELIPELAEVARDNVRRASPHLACRDVAIVGGDAREFEVPSETTILHLYNPFRGSVLDAVMARVCASLKNRSRRMTVLFANPDDFERLLKEGRTFPPGWVRRREDIQWPDAPRVDPDANRYRVYDIVPS